MIKITPRINYYNQQNTSKNSPNFLPAQYPYFGKRGASADIMVVQNKPSTTPQEIKNPIILKALNHLNSLRFDEDDVKYVQSMGAVPPFLDPQDALKFIDDNNIKIKFCALASSNIHAQYDFDTNSIEINKIYEHAKNPAEILAIAEAILHEAGHAKDHDGDSSIQEEFDCLAMNALSHRVFSKKFPNIFSTTKSLIVKDGVCVYADLFFDSNPDKTGLVRRLYDKYGSLPLGDSSHPAGEIAFRVKNELF